VCRADAADAPRRSPRFITAYSASGLYILARSSIISPRRRKEKDKMELSEILSRCDHTLLRTDAGSEEIRRLCDEAVKYGCASVCIPPCHVPGAKKYLAGRVPVCTVIGFPNGYMTTAAKAFEAADAVQKGADEIDMVINLAMVKDADWQAVAEDIAAVRRATEGKVLKVIIECCLLTEAEKLEMCRIVSESGADFIK